MGRATRVAGLAVLLAGCAHAPVPVETSDRHVEQRLLAPGSGEGAASVEPYEPRPGSAFRMPVLLQGAEPSLAGDGPRRELAPTTVCARVAIDAQGQVLWVRPLDDRAGCEAGADPAHADLVAATLAAVAGWRYRPAAWCRYPAGQAVPPDPGDCADALATEPVPVTLEYAFTFEIRHGTVRVRRRGGG